MPEIELLDDSPQLTASAKVVDAEIVAPSGAPCPSCGSPVEADDRFCPACGAPRPQEQIVAAEIASEKVAAEQKFFQCDNCGSRVATDPQHRSYVCPFCDSTYVVEFSPDRTGRQNPEFIIGFAVTAEQAREKFRAWIAENAWFRPGDLKSAAIADKQRGVYLPFWSFSMLAQSRWSSNIGEYWYRTETYTTTDSKGNTVTHTRQVRETEWWPLSGNHHRFYSGFLVSGSRGLPQADAERIKPFQLPALKRYQPYYLAGWLCEEYSVERDAALQVCQQQFYQYEQQNTAAFLPGDTYGNLSVSTNFTHVNSDLCLLPVYVLSYRYRDRLYRFLVNGQTGKCAGDKPLSWKRIWMLAGGIALLIAAGALIIFLLQR